MIVVNLSPAMTALAVVWLWHIDIASDGFLVLCVNSTALSLRTAQRSLMRFFEFMNATDDGHVHLLGHYSIALSQILLSMCL